MTHAVDPVDETRGVKFGAAGFTLPLVSVIIVNYNYGRFLADAISSVFAQSYKNVECFVVDNASTDDSLAVIAHLEGVFPALHVRRRSSNDGQCVASAEVFPETRGQYVVFLDADDVLLPDFVGTHVFVHLSHYTHVGFTCSDMIQVVDGQIVLSTHHKIKYLMQAQVSGGPALRPFVLPGAQQAGLVPVAESDLLHVSRKEKEWCWTATSAFMFRRDALALFIDNPRLDVLQSAIDVYFTRGINAITGSVVINKALSAYRMHGENIFSRHAHLERCLNFEVGGRFDQSERARREMIECWFATAPSLLAKLASKDDFVRGIQTLNEASPRLTAEDGSGRAYAATRLLAHLGRLRAIVGWRTLLAWCWRLGVSPLGLLRAVAAGGERRRDAPGA